MIGKAAAVAAVARLAPLLGRSFDEIAQAQLASNLAGLDLDVDLDAIVTRVMLAGKKYEQALRMFHEGIDDARKNARKESGDCPEAVEERDPTAETKPDNVLIAELAELADEMRAIGRPGLAADADRRRKWIETGRPAGGPHALRVGQLGCEVGRDPSKDRNATGAA